MTPTSEKTLPTLELLQEEAAAFIQNLAPVVDRATLVTLSGELGAGKTSFAQGVAHALGISEPVTSPTFVLQKTYSLTKNATGFETLIHIDAYRLEGEKSLVPLEFSEFYKKSNTLIILEWPEMVYDQLPTADVAITFTVLPDATRSVSYTYGKK